MKTLFLIAGEASGDALGAKLMRALKVKSPVRFIGIGGPKMAAEGLESLFPYSELSLMGFAEVLPHLPKLLRRIRQTVEAIEKTKPGAVITIDSPGFNFQVAKQVKKLGIPLIHYVAPTVWAYKPKRAERMAKWYDLLLLLLPFEGPYFDKVGLKNTFVGHPLVEDAHPEPLSSKPCIVMLPGSRGGEISRHLPIFREVAERLKARGIDYSITMPTLPHLAAELIHETKSWPLPVHVVTTQEERQIAFSNAVAALTKSGTVALELALYHVPMIVTYKVHPLSAWLLRRMIKVPFVNLVNLLLNQPTIPELLQENCEPDKLADALIPLITDREARANQQRAMKEALELLGLGQHPTPSEKAAEAVAKLISL